MGTLNTDSPFISYTLTEEEKYLGSILQQGQKEVIHNLLFSAACQKINLPWTPENLQIEAELQGKIRAYQGILDAHAEAEEYFKSTITTEELKEQQLSQLRSDYTNIFGSDIGNGNHSDSFN